MSRMNNGPLLSFVIPVKNDERVIKTIASIHEYAQAKNLAVQIFICGELDNPKRIKNAIFIKVEKSKKGECVRRGVLKSQADIIVVCDADLPVAFSDISLLISCVQQNDITLGNRYHPVATGLHCSSIYRRAFSRIFRAIVNTVFGLKGFDTQCGIKAYRRRAAQRVFGYQLVRGLAFEIEVILRAKALGMRIQQIPVNLRNSNRSTIRLYNTIPAMLIDILRLWLFWVNGMFRKEPAPYGASVKASDLTTPCS